eukprot:TRINITY_DN4886_c0_g1_i1.p1 TRINITY_DN4886_c0_g1~~TRINITY_DN4886_c0_g1_i1.p1  ORF type:complete len:125 (-),score=32.93 TRINITY_DN4886_c0_g1_i1:16-390(-)
MASKAKLTGATTANVAVIGDQDTVTGFLLAGVGAVDARNQANYLIVDKNTKHSAIEAAFGKFTSSPNVGILLISQPVAESIRYLVSKHTKLIPTILEIPTKEEPYDPEKDSIMQKINRLTGQNK